MKNAEHTWRTGLDYRNGTHLYLATLYDLFPYKVSFRSSIFTWNSSPVNSLDEMKKWNSLSQNDHRLYTRQFLLVRIWTRHKIQLTYKRYPVVSHLHYFAAPYSCKINIPEETRVIMFTLWALLSTVPLMFSYGFVW